MARNANFEEDPTASTNGITPFDTAALNNSNGNNGTPNRNSSGGIRGTQEDDELMGTDQADLIFGLGGNDRMDGLAGNDELRGGAGDDVLTGGVGVDTLRGGAGNDTASYAGLAATDWVEARLGSGIATVTRTDDQGATHVEADTLFSIESLTGGEGRDRLIGNNDANVLQGGGGDDILNGKGGDDDLYGGTGNDVLRGGAGNDTAYLAAAAGAAISATLYEDDFGVAYASVTSDDGTVQSEIDFMIGVENLVSADGDDSLQGNSLANRLIAGAGSDTLSGGGGEDYLDGGEGADTVTYANLATGGSVSVQLGEGDVSGTGTVSGLPDTTEEPEEDEADNGNNNGDGDNETDYTETLVNIENVIGSNGSDRLEGNSADNVLNGQAGDDTLIGGRGNDTLNGGDGSDTIDYSDLTNADRVTIQMGSDGSGVITVERTDENGNAVTETDTYSGIENVSGGAGDDSVEGNDAANNLNGGAGDDTLIGRGGRDVLNGGEGSDTVSYAYVAEGSGVSVRLGEGEAEGFASVGASGEEDVIEEDDSLLDVENAIGTSGNDRFEGNSLANLFDGQAGDDTFIGTAGTDTYNGGEGNDVVFYDQLTTGITLDLTGDGGGTVTTVPGEDGNGDQAETTTLSGIERVYASMNSDTLTGDGGDNWLHGRAGDDVMNGGAGSDTLIGGTGNNTITGGADADYIRLRFGDASHDAVVYQDIIDAGDTISGFRTAEAERDTIDLDALFDNLDAASGTQTTLTQRASAVSVIYDGNNAQLHVNIGGADTLLATLQLQGSEAQDLQNDLASLSQNLIILNS